MCNQKFSENSSSKLIKNLDELFIISLIIMTGLIIQSCKKFVQIPSPTDQIVSSEVFSNDQSAIAAISGLYSQMMQSNLYFINGAMSLYPALSADELRLAVPNQEQLPFEQNAIPVTSRIIQNNLWRYAYMYIYQANAIIEGLSQSNSVSKNVKSQLTGEAKFVRAFCYFYLVNLFGGVPLILATDYKQNELKPRVSVDAIYKHIIADLQDAHQILSVPYPSDGRVRPNKWTATALLARVYLYRKQYDKAEAASSTVINSGDYSLEKDLNKVFLANSTEAIWQLMPVSPYFNTAEGYGFIPSSSSIIPNYKIDSGLLNSFEAGDQRKTDWLDSNIVNGITYYYPYKYKIASGSDKVEYNMILRLAEQYLIRAEARAELDKMNDAVSDLNKIRHRAGLPNTNAMDKQSLINAIRHERREELFTEWGHRWFDLKRWGIIDKVLLDEKPGWRPSDKLYPIPYQEMMSNPNLKQNTEY